MECVGEIVVDLALLFEAQVTLRMVIKLTVCVLWFYWEYIFVYVQEVEELPESVLGTVQLKHLTPKLARRIPSTQVKLSFQYIWLVVCVKNVILIVRFVLGFGCKQVHIPLTITDRITGSEVRANSRVPIPFETELFKGYVMYSTMNSSYVLTVFSNMRIGRCYLNLPLFRWIRITSRIFAVRNVRLKSWYRYG